MKRGIIGLGLFALATSLFLFGTSAQDAKTTLGPFTGDDQDFIFTLLRYFFYNLCHQFPGYAANSIGTLRQKKILNEIGLPDFHPIFCQQLGRLLVAGSSTIQKKAPMPLLS